MSNFYWEDTKKGLTSEEYSSILDDNLYDTFYSARKQFKTGKALIYTGAVFTTVAALCYASYLSSEYYVYNFSPSLMMTAQKDLGLGASVVFNF